MLLSKVLNARVCQGKGARSPTGRSLIQCKLRQEMMAAGPDCSQRDSQLAHRGIRAEILNCSSGL